jgi:hypothetical protein
LITSENAEVRPTEPASSAQSTKGLLKSIFSSSTNQLITSENAEVRPTEPASSAQSQKSKVLTRKYSSKINFELHLQLHQDDVGGQPDAQFDSRSIASTLAAKLNFSEKSASGNRPPAEQISPNQQKKSTILTRKASSKANLLPQLLQSESEQDDTANPSKQRRPSDGLNMSDITINPLSSSGKYLLPPAAAR